MELKKKTFSTWKKFEKPRKKFEKSSGNPETIKKVCNIKFLMGYGIV